jgi:prepilin-type N-terminal cleavage/methylation domain-containing protein
VTGCSPEMSSYRADDGFTLLELLVALVLLAALATMMPGAFQLARQAQFSEEILQESDQRSSVRTYLSRAIGMAMPIFVRPEGRLAVAFSGSADGLRFVTAEAAGPFGSGVYSQTLRVERIQKSSGVKFRLLLTLSPFLGQGQEPAGAVHERLLLETATPISLRFYGNPAGNGERSWQSDWQGADALPELVEIGLPSSYEVSGLLPLLVKPQLGRR